MTKLGLASITFFDVDEIAIDAPYNEAWREDLKDKIPATHRRWDRERRVWIVKFPYVGKARLITAEYFNIEEDE